MRKNRRAILTLLIMSSFSLMGQGLKSFQYKEGGYGLKNAKGEIVSESKLSVCKSFDNYRVLSEEFYLDFNNKVLVDSALNVLYQAKGAVINYHKLDNETIISIVLKRNRPLQFWNWKSDYNWMAKSGKLINTNVRVYTFEFYRLGDKQPFYKYTGNKLPMGSMYDFSSQNDAFGVNQNAFFYIKNGTVKRVRKDFEGGTKEFLRCIRKE